MREYDPQLETAMRSTGFLVGQILETASPRVPIEGSEGHAFGMRGEDVDTIALYLQGFIAEVIQAWIDAGSERDVTMEDERLNEALVMALKGWSTDWEEVR